MTIGKPDRRTFFWFAGLAVFVVLVLMKQAAIRQGREAEIISILNEWQRHGKPVRVETIALRQVPRYIKMTLQPVAPGRWQGFVTPQIQAQIRAGQDVYYEAPEGRVSGTIRDVADTMSLDRGMYAVDVAFERQVEPVVPGLVAYVQVQTFPDAVMVDDAALNRDAGGDEFIWVVRNDRADVASVVASHGNGLGTMIKDGLVPGDMIVVAGQTQLQPGDLVQILSPEDTVAGKQKDAL